MANESENKQVPAKKTGKIGKILAFFNKIISVLLLSLLMSILIEWAGITTDFWVEPGYHHSKQMMLSELGWFESHFTESLLHSSPISFVRQVLQVVNDTLFVQSGIQSWLSQEQGGIIRDYIESAVYVTLTFCIRVMIIVFTVPLFVTAALVGLSDGLVRRDLRRFGRGYESSFIYHNSKRTVLPIMFVAWALYLTLPVSLHPNWILLPAAGLFGLAISIVSGSFKKYL